LDRGSQYLSIKHTERLAEAEIDLSVGTVGDAYDNALAERVIGLFKTEVINQIGPWKSMRKVEWKTLNRRTAQRNGSICTTTAGMSSSGGKAVPQTVSGSASPERLPVHPADPRRRRSVDAFSGTRANASIRSAACASRLRAAAPRRSLAVRSALAIDTATIAEPTCLSDSDSEVGAFGNPSQVRNQGRCYET